MAKLTLSFKGRLISIHHLSAHPMTIGRDRACGLMIDSLAVAPRHAELIPMDTGALLVALDSGYPVLLNNERVDQATLHHGDEIQIGKHTLGFSDDATELMPMPDATDKNRDEPEEPVGDQVPAYLQVQSGPQIGRVVAFRRPVTRLTQVGAGQVIVTRRGGTYHLSRLEGNEPIRIDGELMKGDAEVKLTPNDIIEIGNKRFRFFFAAAAVPANTVEGISS